MKSFNPSEVAIFEAALVCISTEQRDAYLARACSGEPELRKRVEALLAANEAPTDFLENGPRLNPATLNPRLLPLPQRERGKSTIHLDLPSEEKPGSTVGRYKLLQKIGEGGCGLVYMAEQEEPVRRRVALKIIKLGMDTKQVVARFEAERQALAMMDHPNIAKVLDAGATPAGRPFFAMELVRGIKLTEYCDQNNLSTEERLKLFIPVCHAIQHAHQKGIIHRDIKPSNILVTLHDGVPVPKVIDFGIAKATQGRLTNQTLFTAYEQFIGTPAYMSPEQAEMSGLDIDTRADIYSLGVLLYELLTGRTPFDSKDLLAVGLEAMRRAIRETEPQRPSTRLSTMQADLLTTTAAHRRLDPPRLIHVVRGDLDWIVMKALEKDRTRRYETANGLSLDVQRYLNNEPVIARPPGKSYRLRKAIRRNKLAAGVATLITVSLLCGAIVSVTQATRARRAERDAQRERDAAAKARGRAEAISRFLTEDLLYQATPEQTERERSITMEQVLERAAQRLDHNIAITRQPDLEATLRMAVGDTYRRLGLYPEAERQLRAAVKLRQGELGRDHLETLRAQSELVSLLVGDMNRFDDETERLSRETWQSLHQLLNAQKSSPDATNLYRAMLDGEAEYIWALANRGELKRAVELKRANSAAYARLFGPNDIDNINEMHNLALVLIRNGDFAEAERIEEQVLQRWTAMGNPRSDATYSAIAGLAGCRLFQGNARAAEALLLEALPRATRALGADHPATLHLRSYLCRVLAEQDRLEEAETIARETVLARQRVLGTNALNTAYTSLILGRILVNRGKLEEAAISLESTRSIFQEQLGKIPGFVTEAENWLGAICLARKQYALAETLILPGAEHLLAPSAFLSPKERRDAVGHVIELYVRLDLPDRASAWRQRLEAADSHLISERQGAVRAH